MLIGGAHLQHSAVLYIHLAGNAGGKGPFTCTHIAGHFHLLDSMSVSEKLLPLLLLTLMLRVCPHIAGHSVFVKHSFVWLLFRLSLHCC